MMSTKMGRTDLKIFESMLPNRFPTVELFQKKIERKGNFLWKNREFSLWCRRVLVSPSVEGAVMSTMMGRTDIKILESMLPNRFPTVEVFQKKIERKGSFLWKNREFSLWSRHVLVSPGVVGAVMPAMMGWTDLKIFECILQNKFQLSSFFRNKLNGKGIFYGKTENFLSGVVVFLFRQALRVL